MEKSKKKYYYHNNKNNNRNYYPKKKKKREDKMEEKITYEKLVNVESDEIVDYPKETNDDMMKFVAISIIIMAIIFGSLLLFHLI